MKKSIADYPELVKQWHPIKNGDLKPENFTPGSGKKVWWKCPVADDHEWKAVIKGRVRGRGCSCCAGKKVVKSNCLFAKYPEISKQWHPTKNGNLTPEAVLAGSHKKVWWKCDAVIDHEWRASILNRVNGTGCPCCINRKAVKSNCLFATYPELAKQWHPTKNGKLTPYDITAGSNKKVWWKCSVNNNHEWQTNIIHRTHRNSGCPYCSNQKISFENCLATKFPQIATEWHPTKNGDLTPYDIIAGSGKKVYWLCSNKHEWKASPNKRTNNRNCPICNESKGEKCISQVLTTFVLKFKRQWKFKSCKNKKLLPFDFVVKTKNGIKIIEYQGKQHYEPMGFGSTKEKAIKNFNDVKKRDRIKKEWCKKRKVPLLRIPYWKFKQIEKITMDFLKI